MPDLAPEERAAERLLLWGFLTVVVITAAALAVIALGGSDKAQSMADVASQALGVIGTLGGAFVGHRLGSAGRREAQARLDALGGGTTKQSSETR